MSQYQSPDVVRIMERRWFDLEMPKDGMSESNVGAIIHNQLWRHR
jgi:hypothetical protein